MATYAGSTGPGSKRWLPRVASAGGVSVLSIMTNQVIHNILCHSLLMRYIQFLAGVNLVMTQQLKQLKTGTTCRLLITVAIKQKGTRLLLGASPLKIFQMVIGKQKFFFGQGTTPGAPTKREPCPPAPKYTRRQMTKDFDHERCIACRQAYTIKIAFGDPCGRDRPAPRRTRSGRIVQAISGNIKRDRRTGDDDR